MHERYPHPSKQPLLPLTMIVSLVVGGVTLEQNGDHTTLIAAFAFGLFLVAFALYGYAWILRDNSEWIESQRDR